MGRRKKKKKNLFFDEPGAGPLTGAEKVSHVIQRINAKYKNNPLRRAGAGFGTAALEPERATGWHTGTPANDNYCSKCEYSEKQKNETRIYLTPDIYALLTRMVDIVKTEFQVLLTGRIENGNPVINDYYIPKQRVTGATVKNDDCIDAAMIAERGIIATVHSHAGMGVFFSGTDVNETNLNAAIKYHIVINNKMEYCAVEIVSLPCGMKTTRNISFSLTLPETDITGLDNITKETFTSVQHWGGAGSLFAGTKKEKKPDAAGHDYNAFGYPADAFSDCY